MFLALQGYWKPNLIRFNEVWYHINMYLCFGNNIYIFIFDQSKSSFHDLRHINILDWTSKKIRENRLRQTHFGCNEFTIYTQYASCLKWGDVLGRIEKTVRPRGSRRKRQVSLFSPAVDSAPFTFNLNSLSISADPSTSFLTKVWYEFIVFSVFILSCICTTQWFWHCTEVNSSSSRQT